MSQTTSIMTPFTNIGGEVSRYGGKNRMLKQWYEGKCFQPNTKHLGFALNKRELGVNAHEIYSQFSVTNPDDVFENGAGRSSMNTSQMEQEVMDALKNNEFLPQVTFETFLKKKMNRGKRTLFLNKAPNENAREYMKEYMQVAQMKAQVKAEQKLQDLEEERFENERVRDQIHELNEIEIEKKVAMQEQHRENVKQGIEEKRMYQKLQKDYDKAYGFNDFPYTHGDDVERAQEHATLEWRKELVEDLQKKGKVKPSKTVKENEDDNELGGDLRQAPNEEELNTKATTLAEAKQNDNMLNLQTKSLVLRNQVKKDKIDFKNDKQEALYNRFIQETPFYAKKHKAVLARPQ